MKKQIVILGGGTSNKVRPHLSISSVAYGTTARKLADLAELKFPNLTTKLVLTKMADSTSKLESTLDVDAYITSLVNDNTVKIIIFSIAMVDFHLKVHSPWQRLSSKEDYAAELLGIQEKTLAKIRKHRKDIFVVGFKTTYNASKSEQFAKGLDLLKRCSLNLVLANDIMHHSNMIITPEEGVYEATREHLLQMIIDMAYNRSHLSFTRSTVIEGTPVPWQDKRVPANLRTVINWCVAQGLTKNLMA